MKSSLAKFVIFSTLLGISITTFAFPDITGKWRCSGLDPFKQNFSVSGYIHKTGETYALVNWKDDATGEPRSGVGMQSDEIENAFSTVFWADKDPTQIGFGLAKVISADKIIGPWSIKHVNTMGEETCIRIDGNKPA